MTQTLVSATQVARWLAEERPAVVAAEALRRASARLAAQPPGRLVAVGPHALSLDEYLRTRVLELVVHSVDLSRATGVPHGLPGPAVEAACALAGSLAARSWRFQTRTRCGSRAQSKSSPTPSPTRP